MDTQIMPDIFKVVQTSLTPYIKERQETARRRRLLTCYLDSQICEQQQQVLRPLSLKEASGIEFSAHISRSLYRDYLRSLQNNSKAKGTYASIVIKLGQQPESQVDSVDLNTSQQGFLNLVHASRKHERLYILQDYIDLLGQKPPASRDYLNKLALKDAGTQPPMPSEILTFASVNRRPVEGELHDLVDQLEKAILRAKMLLRREQKLLTRIQSEKSRQTSERASRIEALGLTRDELIVWIETELSRAGEGLPAQNENAATSAQAMVAEGSLQSQMESSKVHYSQYISSRQNIISVTDEQTTIVSKDPIEAVLLPQPYCDPSSLTPVIATYLSQFLAVSNDQKAMMQQKSHVTITFAKQLKENGQGLDRLVDESHLLPTHPFPKAISLQTSIIAPVSFEDEMTKGEKPDLSRRAQAWVFANSSAGVSLKDYVSKRLDEGGVALLEAQTSLLDLLEFLGNDVELAAGAKEDSADAWAVLNGKLGVI